jgi:cbb3-type cytochrome oxidase subunit 3
MLQYIATTRSNRNDRAKKSVSQRIASAFTYISLLMYASSTQLCLSLLHCVPVGDNQVLFLDGNIKCYQTFQYFLLGYMISSILPFCLVPVLGSYLLKFGRIGVKQFCAACMFPLPFCCYWLYLLLKECRCGFQRERYNTIEENDDAIRSEHGNDEIQSLGSEEITFTSSTDRNETTSTRSESPVCTDSNEVSSTRSESAVLKVLLGPFRPHQAFMCFPSSHIPWEGFLIFRRLVLIIVLTFVYDIQLRLFVALILCVAILIFHMFVYPFQRKSDNVLESFSLGTHVVLCGSTLIKALYYGEDYSSFSNRFPVLNVIENILILAPLSVIMIIVVVSIAIKLVFALKLCVLVVIRKVRRLVRPLSV